MDTNILLYVLIFFIGLLLGHFFWPSKKNEYIETYNRNGDFRNNDQRSYVNDVNNEQSNDDDADEDEDDGNGRFIFIGCDDMPDEWNFFDVIVDKKTRVQYLQDEEGYSLTPLIDCTGKPILYDGDLDE